MAEGKKSFILYNDIISTVKMLPPDIAGKLFLHVLEYVNGENPTTEDFSVQLAFAPIKESLKRDAVKYEEKRAKNKANAEKRWSKNATACDRIEPHAKHADSVSDSESVSDTTNVVDIGNYSKKVSDGSYSEDPKYIAELDKNIEALKTYDTWKTQVAKLNSIELKEVPMWLDEFKGHILTQGKIDVSVNELKSHFSRWLKKVIAAGKKLPRQMTPEEKKIARYNKYDI